MKTSISILVLSLVISGCAGNSIKETTETPKYNPYLSYGLNILKAGGVSSPTAFEDAKVDKKLYERLQRHDSAENDMVGSSVLGAAMFFDSFDLAGFAGAGLLVNLTSPKHPMNRHHAVMWIPKDMAKTPKEAQELLAKTLYDGVMASASKIPMRHYLYNNEGRLQANVPVCKEGRQDTRYRNCTIEDTLVDSPYVAIAEDVEFKLVKRPNFVAGKGDQAWLGYYDGAVRGMSMWCHHRRVEDKEACTLFNKAQNEGFVKSLPDWMYLYEMNHRVKLGMVKQGSTGKVYPLVMPK